MYNLNDDSIIFEKNINEKLSIASLTKIMTAVVVIENNDPNDIVVINSNAFYNIDGYALAGFKVGDLVTVRDLLYGLMLFSGAECGNMLAYYTTDSYSKFVDMMNDKARELKLDNTNFDNVIGMDSINNYSTVYDLAILLKYALKNELFKEIYTSTNFKTSNGLNLVRTLDNYGKGLDLTLIKGDKTGHTIDAGYCLSSISNIDNIDYLIITLGANNNRDFIIDHINLYNYFKDNYSYRYILKKNQFLISIPVRDAKVDMYDVLSDKDIKKYLGNDINLDDIEYKYDGIDLITRKIQVNDKLGTVSIILNDKILDTYDVYLNTEIVYNTHYLKYIIIVTVFLLIVSIFLVRRIKNIKYRK